MCDDVLVCLMLLVRNCEDMWYVWMVVMILGGKKIIMMLRMVCYFINFISWCRFFWCIVSVFRNRFVMVWVLCLCVMVLCCSVCVMVCILVGICVVFCVVMCVLVISYLVMCVVYVVFNLVMMLGCCVLLFSLRLNMVMLFFFLGSGIYEFDCFRCIELGVRLLVCRNVL